MPTVAANMNEQRRANRETCMTDEKLGERQTEKKTCMIGKEEIGRQTEKHE